MISNVPTANSLLEAGKECFNLAWEMVCDLVGDLKRADDWYGVEADQKTKFWLAARRQLLTALTIVQQGVELSLKGKIAEVSPYLLLTNFEKEAKAEGKDYSEFFTITEQNLVKACNCVSSTPFNQDFSTKYEDFRKLRNKVMHVESSEYKSEEALIQLANDIISYQLYMVGKLFPSEFWTDMRLNHISNSTQTILSEEPDCRLDLCLEMDAMIEFLNDDIVKTYFHVDKTGNSYYCPYCYEHCSNNNDEFVNIKLAYLKSATELYCPVCNKTFNIHSGTSDCCEDNKVCGELCVNCGDQNQN